MPAIKTNESSLKSIFDHDFIFSSRKKRVTIDNQIFAIGFFSPALFRIFLRVCVFGNKTAQSDFDNNRHLWNAKFDPLLNLRARSVL